MLVIHALVCVVLIVQIDCARILTYIPIPSISHQLPFRQITQELARRGHEVVVLTTDPAFLNGATPANFTEIDLHDISYGVLPEIVKNIPKGDKNDVPQFIRAGLDIITGCIDLQLNVPEVKEVINGQKFDILLLEAFASPILALSHVHRVPVIQMSSVGHIFDTNDIIGAPSHPFLYPSATRQRVYNLTFWEKINQIYSHFAVKKMFYDYEDIQNEMLKKHFGADLPPLSELKNNVDMLFLNMHPMWEGNIPQPPSVLYMWGVHEKPQKELPQDLQKFLDSSKHGVIYMSFGTNTDPTTLPPERIQVFVKSFCQLPYDVLWKWNNDKLPGRCSNIKTGKWFPQSDLLRHPNVKAFVTQGGLQSTEESITAGVPLVGIPMMSDQWFNVEKYVHFKIGVQLDLGTLNEEQFKTALTTVTDDESYRLNVKKLNDLMHDEPIPALDRAVWWIEHVLRHGGARHLRSPSANISWAQYLELDLVIILLTAVIISLVVLISILYHIIKILISSSKIKSD